MIYRQGALRGDKVQFKDGIGCTIWYPFDADGEKENVGICFDFAFSDIDDMIALLHKLKEADAEKPNTSEF